MEVLKIFLFLINVQFFFHIHHYHKNSPFSRSKIYFNNEDKLNQHFIYDCDNVNKTSENIEDKWKKNLTSWRAWYHSIQILHIFLLINKKYCVLLLD